jgi:hypothetical protein
MVVSPTSCMLGSDAGCGNLFHHGRPCADLCPPVGSAPVPMRGSHPPQCEPTRLTCGEANIHLGIILPISEIWVNIVFQSELVPMGPMVLHCIGTLCGNSSLGQLVDSVQVKVECMGLRN